MKNDATQRVYLDTQFLFAYISDSQADREQMIAEDVKAVVFNNNPHIKIILPFVVIGETMNIIMRDLSAERRNIALVKLSELLEKDKVDLIPPKLKIFQMASELMKDDRDLRDTDAMILSHALCDECSSHLLTGDGVLLNSQSIHKKCTEWREEEGFRKLIIRNSF